MRRDVLMKRFKEAILEMYNKADNIFGLNMHFDSYDEIVSLCMPDTRDKYAYYKRRVIPYESFFLTKEQQDEIISKATKGCYYTWIWPKKIPIGGDKKFDKYIKELEKYEAEKKQLTPWFRKKRKLELAKKYNLQYRSREAEGLSFEIFNISPTCSKDMFKIMKEMYSKFLKGEKPEDRYMTDILAADYFVKAYQENNVESR